MDKQIKKILEVLNDNGYKAYVIGGYVRDFLLGIKSFDVDICTNALPKDINSLFNSNKNNYGSVNILVGNLNVDITTFRKDFDYVKRKPSKVVYIDSLEEDLMRRDFTINTICLDKDEHIIDLLNGVDDLNKRVIRMIGDIDTKLEEDPLRILRAIRFATILDFKIEDELLNKMREKSSLVKTLSRSRIKDELAKIIGSKNYKLGLDILEITGISDILKMSYNNVIYVDDLLGMWSQIKVYDMPFTNIEKSNIIKINEVLESGKINREILYKYGLYVCTIAAKIMNINPQEVSKWYNELPIKSRSDIDITSNDIIKYLGKGKIVGDTYQDLEKKILNKRIDNNKESIIKYLSKRK